ncbi:MAG: hypothetical protein H0V89_02085 [Deltaproteobacteria bacterium]|nr:hypothetical protein [Deltaproteobacteria bacterium]
MNPTLGAAPFHKVDQAFWIAVASNAVVPYMTSGILRPALLLWSEQREWNRAGTDTGDGKLPLPAMCRVICVTGA